MASSEFSAKSVGVAISCGIGAIFSGASIMANSASVFILPITEEFHWGRSKLSGLMLIGLGAAGIATPLIGRLVDRIGARAIVLVGTVAFALATMAVSLASQSVPRSCFFFALFGFTAPAIGAVGFNKVLSAWFQHRRGIILALVGIGGALGGFVVPQLTRFLIEAFGWRGAYIGLGGIILVVCLPVLAVLFREPSGQTPATKSAAAANAIGATLAEVCRSPTFWLIIGAIAANIFVGVGLQFHVVPLLTDRGLSFDTAVNLSSYFGFGQVGGQLAAGYLLDRFDTPRVIIPFFVASLVGLLMLDYGQGSVMLVLAGLLLRVGVGAELSIAPYLLVRYFGLASFGQVYGVLYLLSTVAAGVGIQALSYSFDVTHSYRVALTVSEFLLAGGVVLVGLLGPYAYAAQLSATDDPLHKGCEGRAAAE